ncbi:hypothetical protein [Streptomyces gobitricini]|uniref:Uncharacterized protein n=1 Tax=Streptomyces gobitricini TaxID=68211 RepID=A0ABN3MX46_9ACTN
MLLAGIARTEQPEDEEGAQLPPGSTLVRVTPEDVLRDTAKTLTRRSSAVLVAAYTALPGPAR